MTSNESDLALRTAEAASVVSALLLAPPSPELVDLLSDPAAAEDWPVDDDRARAALQRVATADMPDPSELTRDHFMLFVGPGRGHACPYESVYLSHDGLLFGTETYAARAEYHSVGLIAPQEGNEPDDHIGLEFAFVSELCRRIAAGEGVMDTHPYRVHLGRFLTEHLTRFAPTVLAAVEKHAFTPPYQALPALATSVLTTAEQLSVTHLTVVGGGR